MSSRWPRCSRNTVASAAKAVVAMSPSRLSTPRTLFAGGDEPDAAAGPAADRSPVEHVDSETASWRERIRTGSQRLTAAKAAASRPPRSVAAASTAAVVSPPQVPQLAVRETVILLHFPLPLVGVSIEM